MGFGYKVQHTGIQLSIANAQVTLDRTNFEYDEQQHAPVLQLVQVGDAELVAYQDYVAYITPATDAGDYNIIVSGMGDYSGAKNVPWHIDKAQGTISVEPQSVSITGAIGTSTTVQLTYKGDGEITFGESEYVSLSREGNTVTVTSKAEGSGSVTITLEDGRNYKGATAELGVEVSTFSNVFDENSWEQIAQAAASGQASVIWNVGDKKAVTINGKTYHMQIIDFDHDDLDSTDAHYSDVSYNNGTKKAAMTLMMEEILSDEERMHSSNDNSVSWEKCEFRTTTLSTIKSQIDPLLVAVARKVTKLTAQSGSSATILKTADDFFMASEIEVFGNNDHSKPGEGTVYNYFQAGNSRVKNKDGSAYYWWLRSPHSGYSANFLIVYSNGSWSSNNASYSFGVVLCVCI